MNTRFLLLLAMPLLAAGCANNQAEEPSRLKNEVAEAKKVDAPPPASLDCLYPPLSPEPAFLLAMLGMAAPMSGIAVDLEEGDFDFARANYDKFATRYREVSKMVPEWEAAFPYGPVQKISAALTNRDVPQVMAALQEAGRICHDCHIKNATRVQQKYAWRDFPRVTATDPVTGQTVNFGQLMMSLETAFEGIAVDLEQRQVDKARKHLAAFSGRMQTLAETCMICHDTERKYYVDASLQTLIEKVRVELNKPSPDAKSVGALRQQIGMETCLKCHRVHTPAAYAQARWREGQAAR